MLRTTSRATGGPLSELSREAGRKPQAGAFDGVKHMSVIFLLIPLSIVIALCFLGAFIWAVRSGQYEDTCTPSMRLLLEEKRGQPKGEPAPKPDPAPLATDREKGSKE
jgi:cbb3-type cytochrome oxidase maturation protein